MPCRLSAKVLLNTGRYLDSLPMKTFKQSALYCVSLLTVHSEVDQAASQQVRTAYYGVSTTSHRFKVLQGSSTSKQRAARKQLGNKRASAEHSRGHHAQLVSPREVRGDPNPVRHDRPAPCMLAPVCCQLLEPV